MAISFETPSTLDDIQPENSMPEMNGAVLPLVQELCDALKSENIAYCHWKSNNMLERSASGENDLDLLVSRADETRFAAILFRLGFKRANAPTEKRMIGVLDYFGYDHQAEKWVHVHAHYQLVMGHDMTKNFRLAFEWPYLESAVQGDLFRVPAVEFEYIVFVIRMILKHSTWDAIVSREGRLKSSERKELNDLQSQIGQEQVNDILEQHLPYIDIDLFRSCVQALQPHCSIWTRVKTGQELQTKLRASAVYPLPIDTFLKFWRRAGLMLRRRILRSASKYRFEVGGAMIAIVGGDGAGKSTAVDALSGWLSKNFETARIHMGKPAWSFTTIIVRSILKVGQLTGLYPLEASFDDTLEQKSLVSPGYPYLIREVCRARDRYWMYVRARRLAAKGKLVILDRFPLPQIQIMDGAQAAKFIRELQSRPQGKQFLSPRLESRIARFLVGLEESYYHQIVSPEFLIVLKVAPEIAVQRKTNEDSASVEKRSREIWQLDWEETNAYIVDASKPKTEVASKLKTFIWSRL